MVVVVVVSVKVCIIIQYLQYNYLLLLKMHQLKQILVQRITNILELQHILHSNPLSTDSHKYEYIVAHKKAQRILHTRQNDILSTMNNVVYLAPMMEQELCRCSMEVFAAYDEGYRGKMVAYGALAGLYCQFFDRHGFKEKSAHIQHLVDKGEDSNLSPVLYMGWLSEWSKKIYCQTLQNQIQSTFTTTRDRSPKQVTRSFTLGMLQNKNKKSQKKIVQNNISSGCTELPDISFANRSNIHSFFLEQLQQYYKLTNIEGVDVFYPKSIRKRYQREQFLKDENLSRAVNVLILCPANKAISQIMKLYQSEYYTKFPKKIIKQVKANDIARKILPFSPVKRRPRNVTETDQGGSQTVIQSKLLTPKMSDIQFIKPEDLQGKIKRINIISQFKSSKNNLQFPGITFKKDLKYLVPDKNMFKIPKSKPQMIVSIQKRLKDRDFLKCESFLQKYKHRDDPSFLFQGHTPTQISSPNRSKGTALPYFNSVYDDSKIKMGKNFELMDLKLSKKLEIVTKMCINQPI